MTTDALPGADAAEEPAGSWRLVSPADIPFVYYLVACVDPRWWRFSRNGLEPSQVLETAAGISAGALISTAEGEPVACALLADSGASGTGMFEYFALPHPDAERLAREFAPALLAAAFNGAPIRRLYYERFSGDADVLGTAASAFELEVTYPKFALIDGTYEDRTSAVLTPESFARWNTVAHT
jgi:hypothetical protein